MNDGAIKPLLSHIIWSCQKFVQAAYENVYPAFEINFGCRDSCHINLKELNSSGCAIVP